jgi:hypothetical protein
MNIATYLICILLCIVTCGILSWPFTALSVVSAIAWFFGVAALRRHDTAPRPLLSTRMYRRLFDAAMRPSVNKIFMCLLQGPPAERGQPSDACLATSRVALLAAGRAGGLAHLLRLVATEEVVAQDDEPGMAEHLQEARQLPCAKFVGFSFL